MGRKEVMVMRLWVYIVFTYCLMEIDFWWKRCKGDASWWGCKLCLNYLVRIERLSVCLQPQVVLQLHTSQVRTPLQRIAKRGSTWMAVDKLVPLSFLFILSINQIILFDNYNTKNTAKKWLWHLLLASIHSRDFLAGRILSEIYYLSFFFFFFFFLESSRDGEWTQ
jgi:hypothetical protein